MLRAAPLLTASLLSLLAASCSLDTGALLPTGDGAAPPDAADGGMDSRPPPRDSCVPVPEACNAADDDCDGSIDEGFDLMADPENCGRCGVSCGVEPANAAATCYLGTCGLDCDTGFEDCDGDRANGCEVSTLSVDNCGVCGRRCTGSLSLCQTLSGLTQCVAACAGAATECPGSICANLDDNPMHCGACDAACPTPPGGEASCVARVCGVACDDGFDDCDGALENGCETDLSSPASCGACANDCARPNSVPGCSAGECSFACNVGFDDCDGDQANGCELAVDTLSDCGSCGAVCEVANGRPDCATATCEIAACDPGYTDCNGLATDGCETRLDEDEDHCGACGTFCGGVCNGGECHPDCVAGPCNDGCDPSAGLCTCGDGAHCGYLCTDPGPCDVKCEHRGTQCTTLGSSPSAFDGECKSGARCDFLMQSGGDIVVECKDAGTSCVVDCRGAATCAVRCHNGAACRLHCDATAASCGYSECPTDQTTCPDGSVVCDRGCRP